mmetsp:Transcript_1280/g.2057  ORF Transcript_1280/g.2057 Transcript_1280/m.2057 type:complete len:416 (+) Transcript_1280:1041-2288(+)
MVDYFSQTHINDQIHQIIKQTIFYMKNQVLLQTKYDPVRRYCQNKHPKCSYWASRGHCDDSFNDIYHIHGGLNDGNGPWMQINCAPACQSCLALEFWNTCNWDTTDEFYQDVLKPGGINAMFERIVKDNVVLLEGKSDKIVNFPVTILSRPVGEEENVEHDNQNSFDHDDISFDHYMEESSTPWIISIPNFLDEEECSHLISLGHNIGFEISTEESAAYGKAIVSEGRTSRTAWCEDDFDDSHNKINGGRNEKEASTCANSSIVQKILRRIEKVTQIPTSNFEPLQFLWYEEGQFYEDHHDFIDSQVYRSCGPRVLTFFLYLNDVEEGGETRFTRLHSSQDSVEDNEYIERKNTLAVAPKKGTALIWSNVLDGDPSRIDEQMYHKAMPVKQGSKYAVNVWLHLRNHKVAAQRGCN